MNLAEAKEIFGLDEGYSESDVKAKYKSLAKKFHPDLNKDNETSNYFMRQINEAYEILLHSPFTVSNNFDQSYAEEAKRYEEERRRREAEEKKRREAEEKKRKEQEEKLEKIERDYQHACEVAKNARTASEYTEAAELFRKLGNYKNSNYQRIHNEVRAEGLIEAKKRFDLIDERMQHIPYKLLWAFSCISVIIASLACGIYWFIQGPQDNILFLVLYALSIVCAVWCLFFEHKGEAAAGGIWIAGGLFFIAYAFGFESLPIYLSLFMLAQLLGAISCPLDIYKNKVVVVKTIFTSLSLITFIVGLVFLAIS